MKVSGFLFVCLVQTLVIAGLLFNPAVADNPTPSPSPYSGRGIYCWHIDDAYVVDGLNRIFVDATINAIDGTDYWTQAATVEGDVYGTGTAFSATSTARDGFNGGTLAAEVRESITPPPSRSESVPVNREGEQSMTPRPRFTPTMQPPEGFETNVAGLRIRSAPGLNSETLGWFDAEGTVVYVVPGMERYANGIKWRRLADRDGWVAEITDGGFRYLR